MSADARASSAHADMLYKKRICRVYIQEMHWQVKLLATRDAFACCSNLSAPNG